MIRILEGEFKDEDILNRELQSFPEHEQTVRNIIGDVIARGDAALYDYEEKFDKVRLESLAVTQEEIDQALSRISPDFLETLKQARDNITFFHEKQKREGFTLHKDGDIVLGQKITPIEKVGLYVPGGTAAYPSTVLMNAIPAKIAGVGYVCMVTPPNKEGKVKDEILAAAALCGVDRIFKLGGAQAIAALAYGTESVPAVSKIVGPGNIFVAIAKKMVFGKVGIDMIAGPSEILVLADKEANPRYVAADLLSQAEHDKLASAVLVTDSRPMAEAVQQELAVQLAALPRREIAETSIEQNGKIILVHDMEEAVAISNRIAPEHLELAVADPFAMLPKIRNAGSIFMGQYAPEPLGDYFAGPNHTLPTSGSAKFSSPLSVDDFIKKSSFLYYPRETLLASAGRIADFAEREGLSAHARSILARCDQ